MQSIEEIRDFFESSGLGISRLALEEFLEKMILKFPALLPSYEIAFLSQVIEERPFKDPQWDAQTEARIVRRLANPLPEMSIERSPEIRVFIWVFKNSKRALTPSEIAAEIEMQNGEVRTAISSLLEAEMIERHDAPGGRGIYFYQVVEFSRIRELLTSEVPSPTPLS